MLHNELVKPFSEMQYDNHTNIVLLSLFPGTRTPFLSSGSSSLHSCTKGLASEFGCLVRFPVKEAQRADRHGDLASSRYIRRKS